MTVVAEVASAADWRADQLAHSDRWRFPLTDTHRAEVLAALDRVESAGTPLGDISRDSFPLPTLGTELARLAAEVTAGRGFTLLRGVPVDGRTERQREILGVGIGSHFGTVVGQGPEQVTAMHVRDEGADPERPTTRSYQHSRPLGFHADPTDAVALLCVRPARSGGLSSIVSSVAVHNEVVRTRPHLAELLYQPWWHDRRTGDGPDSFVQRPVYTVDGRGRLRTHYGPDYIRSAQRGAHVPPLTPAQLDAMAALDRLNQDPRFMLTMDLRAGDMQLLNNAVILHSRTAYQDHPEPERRRHLIRLWLDTGRPA
ncbi:MAG TPA: TauD/TfdA family dioxygenase [Micromonospora sp.]